MSDDLSKVEAITLTADQAAMLRKVLAAIGGCEHLDSNYKSIYVPLHLVNEARAIVALLPERVDADLVEARKLAAEVCAKIEHPWEAKILAGEKDEDAYSGVGLALAAIRRGRALERDSREG